MPPPGPRPPRPPADGTLDSTAVPGSAPTAPGPAAGFPFLAPALAPGELGRLGKYRVLGVLGRGGMGVVFRAEDPTLRREVALKVMLPQFAENPHAAQRFLREARTQAAVEHDHVLPIFAAETDRGVPFIAMPLLKGMPLSAALKAARPPLPELLRAGREIAEGLAAAHEQGLVHRDVKPANIWLEGARRRVKILDFGLARAAEGAGDGADDPVTQSGGVVGTPAYMAPEQANGQPVDARTDLFSLGVILYEMATGTRPFAGGTAYATLAALATYHPPPAHHVAPDCPPELGDLIAALMVKDPAHRPGSAAWVAQELARVEQNLSVMMSQAVPLGGDTAGPWAELDSFEATAPTLVPAAPPAAPAPRPGPSLVAPAAGGAAAFLLVLLAAGVWLAARGPATGTVTVAVDDRAGDPELVFAGDAGEVRTYSRSVALKPGSYRVTVAPPARDGVRVSPAAVTVTAGRTETVAVTVARRPPPPPPPPPLPTPPFLERRGATPDELLAWVKELPGKKYRLTWVAPRAGADPPRLDAVAVHDPNGPDWELAAGTYPGLSARSDALHKDSYRVGFRTQYPGPDGLVHMILWVRDWVGNWSYWNGNQQFIEGKLLEAQPGPMQPVALHGCEHAGGRHFVLVLERQTVGAKWEYEFELSSAELADRVADARRRGWWPRVVAVDPGRVEPRYAAVFAEPPPGLTWDWSPALSAAEFGRAAAERAAGGFRPQSVNSSEAGGRVVYTVVWAKPAP